MKPYLLNQYNGLHFGLLIMTFMFFFSCTNSKTIIIPQDAFLVDVRTAEEFKRGTVENAINIPLSSIELNLVEFDGKDNIVVFCRSGGRSGKAKKILEKNGYKNIINGGSWKQVNAIINR